MRRAAGGRAAFHWAERFADQGVEVHVAVPPGSELEGAMDSIGVPWINFRLAWPRPAWPWPFLLDLDRVRRYVKRHRIQLLHTNGFSEWVFTRPLARLTGLPAVASVRFFRERGYCQWMLKRSPPPARLICVTPAHREYQVEHLRGLYNLDHLTHVLNPLDTGGFAPGTDAQRREQRTKLGVPEEAFCVGIVGQIREFKRTHLVYRVVERLREAGVDAWGVIAGRLSEQDYGAQMDQARRDSPAGEQVVLAGRVDDVAGLLHACDLTVSFSRGETFGYSAADSVACATPVLYFDDPALRIVIGPGGEVFEPDDIESLAARAVALARDRGALGSLGEAGRSHALSQLSAEASTSRLAGIYREVIAETGR